MGNRGKIGDLKKEACAISVFASKGELDSLGQALSFFIS
jgi:hypothetical protein